MHQAVTLGRISGIGQFGKQVRDYFQAQLGSEGVFLTSSCTSALELAALLCDLKPGDEVILPSFTHVSTANAFVRAGATLRFADSQPDHPNIAVSEIERLLSDRTRVIVPVHYMGHACDMDAIMRIAQEHDLLVVEDAAHAIGATYKGRPLGSIGHFGTLSFHETKNITCGHGGLLSINDPRFLERAWRIYDYGTNRNDFRKGEVEKYTWVEVGSCFAVSELNAAWLWGQLQHFEAVAQRRLSHWRYYQARLHPLQSAGIALPTESPQTVHNGHIFYLVMPSQSERDELIRRLASAGILAVFHYSTLHDSPYFSAQYAGPELENASRFSRCLVRLPLFDSITESELEQVCSVILGA